MTKLVHGDNWGKPQFKGLRLGQMGNGIALAPSATCAIVMTFCDRNRVHVAVSILWSESVDRGLCRVEHLGNDGSKLLCPRGDIEAVLSVQRPKAGSQSRMV